MAVELSDYPGSCANGSRITDLRSSWECRRLLCEEADDDEGEEEDMV